MKLFKKSLLALLLGLSLTACGVSKDKLINTEFTRNAETESQASQPVSEVSSETASFDYSMVPEYTGSTSVAINNNVPFFNADEKAAGTASFEIYSELDDLRRCGIAYACIGKDIMPTEERGQIGMVKPTGWHTVKYDCVDGKYLYNRCHLIAYCLAGENANEKNLITGTRYLNIEGMLPYETMTAKYMDNNPDNHVLYRVTPVFVDSELVARGVLMEGYSVEDNGAGINFCVFCYNVQPDVEIDYANGESSYKGSAKTNNNTNVNEIAGSYVVNTSSKKFHTADCKNAGKISDKNREVINESRDELIADGYEPSKCCNP